MLPTKTVHGHRIKAGKGSRDLVHHLRDAFHSRLIIHGPCLGRTSCCLILNWVLQAYGNSLLKGNNALAHLDKSNARDTAIVLMVRVVSFPMLW